MRKLSIIVKKKWCFFSSSFPKSQTIFLWICNLKMNYIIFTLLIKNIFSHNHIIFYSLVFVYEGSQYLLGVFEKEIWYNNVWFVLLRLKKNIIKIIDKQ